MRPKIQISLIAALFLLLVVGLPAYSYSTGGELTPSGMIIKQEILSSCPPAESKSCMETADVISAVAGLYETVIVVLVGLLSVTATLVFLSIRTDHLSKLNAIRSNVDSEIKEIKSGIDAKLEKKIEEELSSKWFKAELREQIAPQVSSAVSELAERLGILERAVERIKARDDAESVIRESTIIVPE